MNKLFAMSCSFSEWLLRENSDHKGKERGTFIRRFEHSYFQMGWYVAILRGITCIRTQLVLQKVEQL